MLDPARLLTASATVERVLWMLFPLACAMLWLRARRSPAGSRLEIGATAERMAMLVVLAWVLLTRLVGATSPHQPRWYFSQINPVFVADFLDANDRGRRWVAQLENVQVQWEF